MIFFLVLTTVAPLRKTKKYRGSDSTSFSDDSGLSVCPYDFSTSRCIAWLFNGV